MLVFGSDLEISVFFFHFLPPSWNLFHLTFSFSFVIVFLSFSPFLCLSLSLLFLGLKQPQKNIFTCLLRCAFSWNEFYTSFFLSKHRKHFICTVFFFVCLFFSYCHSLKIETNSNSTTAFKNVEVLTDMNIRQTCR